MVRATAITAAKDQLLYTIFCIICVVVDLGSALRDLQAFPKVAKRKLGFQLNRLENGLQPNDWKPMRSLGAGVCEIRVRDEDGSYRLIYVATFETAIYVLHCFCENDAKNKRAGCRYRASPIPNAQVGRVLVSAETFASVWDAIEDSPAEAENMRLRSDLMIAIQKHIEMQKLTQTQAAKLFGVTQPRMSDLKRGKIDLFSLDTLVNMVAQAGLHVDMRISSAA